MHTLGLKGMAEKGQDTQLDREEWLALMLDREAATRADRRLTNRLRQASLRFPEACIEDIDFDRRNILSLAQGEWLKTHDNLILVGQTGTGKTWLACAFGHQAARLDRSVLYVRMPRLFEDLAMARLDGRLPRLIDKLARVQLLILDDWGTHGLTDRQRLDLLEICEEQYRRRSTLITAQLPVAKWHDLIGEATVADAILDRIVHNAHRINLKGESMRRKNARPDLTPAGAPEKIPTDKNQAPGAMLKAGRDLVKSPDGITEIRKHSSRSHSTSEPDQSATLIPSFPQKGH